MRLALVSMVALACGACGGAARERAFCERLGQLCDERGMSAQDLAECGTDLPELRQAFGAEQYERLLTCGTEATSCMEIVGCMGGLAVNVGEQALDDLMRGVLKMRPADTKPTPPPEDPKPLPGDPKPTPPPGDLQRPPEPPPPGDVKPAPPPEDLQRPPEQPPPGASKPAPPPEDLQRGPEQPPPEDLPPPLPPECKRADEVCSADEPFARDKCVQMVGNLKADDENRARLVRCYEASKNCFAFKKCTTDMWFELN